MTVVNFQTAPGKWWSKDMKYKVPKISNKTEKGKWLNGFVKKFFVAGNHNYRFTTAKNYALFSNKSGLYDEVLKYLK
mgnify:CR=1 FL=1